MRHYIMEAQAELPVDAANPYFTPAPGYGKRRLLFAHEPSFEGKQNFPYRTNCFEARSYNPDFPNLVFKSMNNESDGAGAASASARTQLGARADDQTAELGSMALDDEQLTLCYGNNNPDLRDEECDASFFGEDVKGGFCHTEKHFERLDKHWTKRGKKEWEKTRTKEKGKFCSDFTSDQKEALCYGNRYHHLRGLCGGRCRSYWHAFAMKEHYERYGRGQGRTWGCAPSREALCYGNIYADLRNDHCGGRKCKFFNQSETLEAHYQQHGVTQRRRFGCRAAGDVDENENVRWRPSQGEAVRVEPS